MPVLADILKELSGKLPKLLHGYSSMYHWVLENGIPYDSQPLTRKEWELVQTHVQYTMPCQCFANCQQTVLEPLFPQVTDIAHGRVGVLSPFDYVEGYVLSPEVPIPLHHAWLLLL